MQKDIYSCLKKLKVVLHIKTLKHVPNSLDTNTSILVK